MRAVRAREAGRRAARRRRAARAEASSRRCAARRNRTMPGRARSAASSTAAPRSEAIVRSPSEASETTTPVRPPVGPATSTPRPASSRVTSSPAVSSPRLPTKRASAPSSCAHAATFAACPPAPVRVAATWSSPVTSGCASSTITSSKRSPRVVSRTSTIVAWKAGRAAEGFARSRSAGSSVPPARSRPFAARRAARGAPRDAPGGLVAFEDAPCFLEILGEQAQRYREGGDTRPGRRTRRSARS